MATPFPPWVIHRYDNPIPAMGDSYVWQSNSRHGWYTGMGAKIMSELCTHNRRLRHCNPCLLARLHLAMSFDLHHKYFASTIFVRDNIGRVDVCSSDRELLTLATIIPVPEYSVNGISALPQSYWNNVALFLAVTASKCCRGEFAFGVQCCTWWGTWACGRAHCCTWWGTCECCRAQCSTW